MIKRSRIAPAVLLLVLAVGSAWAQTPSAKGDSAVYKASVALAPWFKDAVDTSGDVGAHTSIVIDPDSGTTYVSYYDAGQGDLRVAKYVGSGGNCGPRGDWSCETVDGDASHGDADVGQYSSIALDPVSGYPGVAYYDATNYALKYAAYMCTPHACSWGNVTIESGSATLFVGQHALLKYDSNRRPHVAYQRAYTFPGADDLRYARFVNNGGNCGPANSWQCDTVDSSDGVGQYTSLGLSLMQQPYIAYYDGGNGDLKYAWFLGTGTGNCTNDDWHCITIDASGDVGRHASLHVSLGGGDVAGIAYYDETNGDLKYAHFVDSGGNCGGGLWQCDVIDQYLGSVTTPVGLSLASYSASSPVIVYHCPTCYCTTVRMARYGGAPGNCGPAGTWQCDNVVSGIDFGCHDVGKYAAFTLNSAGLATIAFYDANAGDLLVAYQRLQVFLPLLLRNE